MDTQLLSFSGRRSSAGYGRQLSVPLGSGLRAVMLATMMLSGRGVATALKVPRQNFSKSCFSPCCTLAMAPARLGTAALRGADLYIPPDRARLGSVPAWVQSKV